MEHEKLKDLGRIIFFVTPPVVDIKDVGERIMPLKNIDKFYDILQTHKSFVGIDDRYFWVSGNYEVCFNTKPGQTTKSLEQFVMKSIDYSGGFMTKAAWKRKHIKTKSTTFIGCGLNTNNIEYK